MTERINEPALSVGPPRRLMVPHGVASTVRAYRHGPLDEGVRIVNEDLDPSRSSCLSRWDFPSVVLRLGQEERRFLDLQTDD
jgi:hypothetical protein